MNGLFVDFAGNQAVGNNTQDKVKESFERAVIEYGLITIDDERKGIEDHKNGEDTDDVRC